jgi:hypothetical protein
LAESKRKEAAMRVLRITAILLVGLLLGLLGIQSGFAESGSKVPEIVYPPMALMINGQRISPGDSLAIVIGNLGFPDQMRAMRGKDKTQDYIHLMYFSYELSIDISSENNLVKGILLEDEKLKVPNLPFRIGEPYQKATKLWGKADKESPGFICYWKRGVYLGVGDDGGITYIFLTEPGKDKEEDTQKK